MEVKNISTTRPLSSVSSVKSAEENKDSSEINSPLFEANNSGNSLSKISTNSVTQGENTSTGPKFKPNGDIHPTFIKASSLKNTQNPILDPKQAQKIINQSQVIILPQTVAKNASTVLLALGIGLIFAPPVGIAVAVTVIVLGAISLLSSFLVGNKIDALFGMKQAPQDLKLNKINMVRNLLSTNAMPNLDNKDVETSIINKLNSRLNSFDENKDKRKIGIFKQTILADKKSIASLNDYQENVVNTLESIPSRSKNKDEYIKLMLIALKNDNQNSLKAFKILEKLNIFKGFNFIELSIRFDNKLIYEYLKSARSNEGLDQNISLALKYDSIEIFESILLSSKGAPDEIMMNSIIKNNSTKIFYHLLANGKINLDREKLIDLAFLHDSGDILKSMINLQEIMKYRIINKDQLNNEKIKLNNEKKILLDKIVEYDCVKIYELASSMCDTNISEDKEFLMAVLENKKENLFEFLKTDMQKNGVDISNKEFYDNQDSYEKYIDYKICNKNFRKVDFIELAKKIIHNNDKKTLDFIINTSSFSEEKSMSSISEYLVLEYSQSQDFDQSFMNSLLNKGKLSNALNSKIINIFNDEINNQESDLLKTLLTKSFFKDVIHQNSTNLLENTIKNDSVNEFSFLMKIILNNRIQKNSNNDLFIESRLGDTVVKNLMKNNSIKIIDSLVTKENHEDTLKLAIKYNSLEIVKHLLESPLVSNKKDFTNKIFKEALKLNNHEVCKFLIGQYSNVNEQDYNGKTLIMHFMETAFNGESKINNQASLENILSLLTIMISKGVDLKLKDNDGLTALHYLVLNRKMSSEDNEKIKSIIKMLIIKGANINAMNKNSLTPLLMAVKTRNFELCKFLLFANADETIKPRAPHGEFFQYLRDYESIRTDFNIIQGNQSNINKYEENIVNYFETLISARKELNETFSGDFRSFKKFNEQKKKDELNFYPDSICQDIEKELMIT